MELLRTQAQKMYAMCHLSEPLIYLTCLQGEGKHKRLKQFYPWVRKGDHVCGIAQHVYREQTLTVPSETGIKKKN